MRGTLCQIINKHLQNIEIIFGDTIQSIEQNENAVNVIFKNSSARKFDLIIGADGLHSNVRRLVFGDEKNFIHNFGIYLCVFTVPNYLNLDRIEMQYTEFGRMAAVWSTRAQRSYSGAFCCSIYCLKTDNGAPPQLRIQ